MTVTTATTGTTVMTVMTTTTGTSAPDRLDDLRRQRAEDLAAVIDAQPALPSCDLLDPDQPLPTVDLLACSARELAWLQHAVALVEKQAVRTVTVPRATTGVVAPFEPSVVTVSYTARYFLAKGASSPPSEPPPSEPSPPRDAYTVYGAITAGILSDGLRIHALRIRQ